MGGLGVLWAVWCVVWVTMTWRAAGFSRGSVSLVCGSMRPGHLARVRSSAPPYGVFITNKINGYYVTVKGKDNVDFKGFMLQARDEDGNRVGRFVNVQDTGRIMSCSFSGGGVQHKNSKDKDQVTALWQPGNFTGKVKFRATVVQSYFRFWTGVESELLDLS